LCTKCDLTSTIQSGLGPFEVLLFLRPKKTLKRQQFPNKEYLKAALVEFFDEKHPDFFKKAFLKLAVRWKSFINVFRVYIEK